MKPVLLAFFSRRLSRVHYLGVSYQFAKITTFPVHSDTNTNTVMGFFTIYPLGLSHSRFWEARSTTQRKPHPVLGTLSGHQLFRVRWLAGRRVSIAGSYSRMVSVSSGLVGAYHVNTFDAGCFVDC